LFAALTPTIGVACTAEGIDTSQFSEDYCNADGLQLLQAITPNTPLDYLELRSEWESYYGYNDGYVTIEDAVGTRCGGSKVPEDCEAAWSELPTESEFGLRRSLAYTRGDRAGAILAYAELSELIDPIDSAAEATLMVLLDGRQMVCDSDNDAGRDGEDFIIHTRSGHGCGENEDIEEHTVAVSPLGSIEVVETVLIERGDPNCAVGRLPACLRFRRWSAPRRPMGAFLGDVAGLEAAAVPAFRQLGTELTAHGAPRTMVAAASRSARDEVRHARVMALHARRYGAHPRRASVGPLSVRPMAEVAADNAAEGCIRETYGALVAHVQASSAADPLLRQSLRRIALEETRHAALSWAVDAWMRSRLSRADRNRVERSTRIALERLRDDLTRDYADEVHRLAGMPRPSQARALFDRLRVSLA